MSAATDLADALTKSIGNNDDTASVDHWLDTGYPPLNKVIGGDYDKGIPGGRITEIYGPSSSGKTLLATLAMLKAQEAGGVAGFSDHENTFDISFAKKLGMVDSFPQWIYKRPKTWEESNTIAMKAAETIRKSKAIPENAPIVWVFDSIAAMIPRSVFEKGIDEYTMNDTTALARVTSTTLKAVNSFTADLNVTMIYLNQVRTKPGVVYGDPTTTPGGVAMEFYASVRLALGRKKIMDDVSGEKEFVGQNIGINNKKNKVARPFQSCDLRLSFDEHGMAHFDFTASLLEYLVGKGKLVASGPRITWIDGKSYFKKALAVKINEENAYPELVKLCV